MDCTPNDCSDDATFDDIIDVRDDDEVVNVEVLEEAVDTQLLGTDLFCIDVKISKQFCGVVNDFDGLFEMKVKVLLLLSLLSEYWDSVPIDVIGVMSLLELSEIVVVVLTDVTIVVIVLLVLVQVVAVAAVIPKFMTKLKNWYFILFLQTSRGNNQLQRIISKQHCHYNFKVSVDGNFIDFSKLHGHRVYICKTPIYICILFFSFKHLNKLIYVYYCPFAVLLKELFIVTFIKILFLFNKTL